MQYIIEKSKRFVISANSRAEAIKKAGTFDDKNALAHYEILGSLTEPLSENRGDDIDQRRT